MRASQLFRASWLTAASLAVAMSASAYADNATIPGDVTAYSTIECAGVEWRIQGDDNQNCAVSMSYRKQGDTAWKEAQPLMRVEIGIWNPRAGDPGNLLAGSVFNLDVGTAYELKLNLADPDGGAAEKIVTVTTRTEPKAAANSRTLYVAPGIGAGSGSEQDPFKGLAAADAAAKPGDIFILQPGTYNVKFAPKTDGTADAPIVYRGSNVDTAIVDGNGDITSKDPFVINLVGRKYIFIESMTIKNAYRLINANESTGIVIRSCRISPVQSEITKDNKGNDRAANVFGIQAGNTHDLFVADNIIQMVGEWEKIGRTSFYGRSGYGIVYDGVGDIVCYNTILDAWDAVSLPEDDKRTVARNCDVYNNLLLRANDDAVQADSTLQNIRVFRNHVVNCGVAFSCQPVYGGPCYFMFNDVYNCRHEVYKFHQETYIEAMRTETSGVINFHNTSIDSRQGAKNAGVCRNVKNRNNLMLGGLPDAPTLEVDNAKADFDYDGYNRRGKNLIWFHGTKVGNTGVEVKKGTYPDLKAFYAATGNEQHGIEVPISIFVKADYPRNPELKYQQGWRAPYDPSEIDLQLKPGCEAVDKGQVLPNINDGFTGAAPDLGCYEIGKPVPFYGSRTLGR